MNKIYSVVALLFVSIDLVSCANVSVSKSIDGKTFTELPGVPFYTKIPVLTQETKQYASYLLVQVELDSTVDGKTTTSLYPESGPIPIPNTLDNYTKVKNHIQDLLDETLTPLYGGKPAAEKIISKYVKKFNEMDGLKAIGDDPDESVKLLSNTWGLSMIVGPEQHYISGRTPLLGSADVQFEFDGDGTLTKAHSNVVDDTAKTALALFPINLNFEKRWKLGDYKTADFKKTFPAGKEGKTPVPPAKEPVKPEETFDVKTSIKEMKRVYTLKQVSKIAVKTWDISDAKPPLKLSECKAGSCQVASAEEITEDSDKKGADKGEAKGYRIQATILPPETPEKPADGGDKKK